MISLFFGLLRYVSADFLIQGI